MNKFRLFLGALAFIGFAACSSSVTADNAPPPDSNPPEGTVGGGGGGGTIGGGGGGGGMGNNPGYPDTTLGTGGKVTTQIAAGDDIAYAVALQSDKKIVVAGHASGGFGVARYLEDGTLDTAFDTDGKVTTLIGASAGANAVAIQTDGKIVVAGYTDNGTDRDFALARYNTDGSLDTSFDSDGIVVTAISADDDEASGLALQNDDEIVVAGYTDSVTNGAFALARYSSSNGSLDTSFDTDGIVITAIGSGARAKAVRLQGNQRILAAGYADSATDSDFALVRYTTSGGLDSTFSSDGIAIADFGASSQDAGNALAIHADGRIVVAGVSDLGTSTDAIALVRYLTDGTIDATLGTTGHITTFIGTASSAAQAVAIQDDDRIVVAGYVDPPGDFVIARYSGATGRLNQSFATEGVATTAIGTGSDQAQALVIQTDGNILAAGGAYSGSQWAFAIARYWW